MQEEQTLHLDIDTPDVETLHDLLSDMTIPSSPTTSSSTTPPLPPHNLWTHLPLELRQTILTHLLTSLHHSTLHIFAHPSNPLTARTPNPLLATLRALLATSVQFRTDLRAPLNSLCTDLLRRWHRLLRDAHVRLYKHVEAQFAMGNVHTVTGVFSVKEALRKASYAGNEYYQSVANRVLYGEGNRDAMLGRVGQGWEGLYRIWWKLEVSPVMFRLSFTFVLCLCLSLCPFFSGRALARLDSTTSNHQ